MKKIQMSLMLLFACVYMHAQNNTITVKVLSEGEKEALFGATVYFNALKKGEVTNVNGVATFSNVSKDKHSISISYLGFETLKTVIDVTKSTSFTFHLHGDGNEFEEVIVQSSRSTRTVKKIPTRIEFIGLEELGEKAIMNPANISMVLRESTGIQMQQTSLSSGNSNIRIQGLDGRYTQLLRDGFPLYGGFSSGLSIMQIPPLDLQQFEIIKGSSSTLYGGGAIAGLVNMISKTPEEEADLDIMLTQTHVSGSTANIYYGKRNDKFGITLYGSGHVQKEYDADDDDFTNLPKTTSLSFNPKFFYYPSEKTTLVVGVNGTYDDRVGGDITSIKSGKNGLHQYTEENKSKRISSQTVYTTQIDSISSFTFKNSISYFDRILKIPSYTFDGTQNNSFTEATYYRSKDRSDWIFGANLYTVNFKEDELSSLKRTQKELTYGMFANNTYDLSENWILESGLRFDFTNDWGFYALPRISLLYKNDKGFSSRIGGGLGYKVPDIFTEEAELVHFENVLGIDKDLLKAETSYGVNLDFNYQTRLFDEVKLSLNQLFYVTAIKNGLLLNPINNGFYAFENASGAILSKGAETNIKFSYKDFRWFLNYAYINTTLNYLPGNPQKNLTAKHNAGSVLMYESEKWRIGYETFYTGKQLMSTNEFSKDFITMGFLLMRNFNWGGTFVNFENFTNTIQSDFSPLVLGHQNPNFPEIYAPSDGFVLSVGVIIKPFGNKGH